MAAFNLQDTDEQNGTGVAYSVGKNAELVIAIMLHFCMLKQTVMQMD